jgi:hypothetical protein
MIEGTDIHFLGSVIFLAALLFFPVSKMIWVFSVRRLQRRLNKQLNAEELAGQLSRARFIAVFVTLAFSYFFNTNVIRGLYG